MKDIERRTGTGGGLTVAARASGKATQLIGYAAKFNSETVIAGCFREVIAPGAFADALKKSNTVCLWNHDPNHVLGRRSNRTLTLQEDAVGLRYVVTPPDTATGRDVLTLVQRGDVSGSSFAFTVARDMWTFPTRKGALPLREIQQVDQLIDVSAVLMPAYESATVEANSDAITDAATRLRKARLRMAEAESKLVRR
jgi:hypothetical protein